MAKNTLTDLMAQKTALERKIAEMQTAHRSEAITKVKAMMAEYGLTAADIGGGPPNPFAGARGGNGAAKSSAKSSRSAAQGAATAANGVKQRKASANAGRKVAPKYRDPATGNTWSGRGLKPKWLSAALSSGRALADFAL